MDDMDHIVANLIEERRRLRAALMQYADLDNWNFGMDSWWLPCRVGPGPAQRALQPEEEREGE